MNEIEVTIKSLLPADEAQGVYRLRIGRHETAEKLLRNLCQETQSVFRDEYCLRSKEHQLLNRSDTIADIGLQDGAFLHWTSETENVTPGSCCNVFYFLAFLSFAIGVTGIVALCVIRFRTTHPIIDYAIVFDAGSSHSAMFIYKWDGSKLEGTAVAEQTGDSCKGDGKGISSFAAHPEQAGKSLEACLEKAKKAIPKPKHAKTPIYLGATAGMRLLNISDPKASAAIMNSVRSTFKKSPFDFPEPKRMARIISGFSEGSFSWITSNYLTNAFDVLQYQLSNGGKLPASTIVDTVGALDLGGASTQITFIAAKDTEMPPGYFNEMELFGHNYTAYTHSYLCYGTNEVRQRILAYLVNQTTDNDTEIVHQCLPTGFNMTLNSKDIFDSPCVTGKEAQHYFGSSIHPPSGHVDIDRNFTFKGDNDSAKCENLVHSATINTSIPCNYPRCSFNGIYQPQINGLFYAFSSYYYTTSFLNLTSHHSYFNYSDFLQAIDNICDMPWAKLKTLPEPLEFLPWYCENAVYIKVLLTQYGFDKRIWPDISFTEKVSSSEVGWTLGFVLNESNSYPSDTPGLTVDTLIFILLMVLFGFLLVVAICLAYHGKRARYYDGYKPRKMSFYGAI